MRICNFQIRISLKRKTTGEILPLIIKHAGNQLDPSTAKIIGNLFFNEIHFYENIWKTLVKFQKTFPRSQSFNKIPKMYASSSESGEHNIVLENLNHLGFEMFPRSDAFNEQQMEVLLTAYGQFHGISAALREHKPHEFKALTQPLKNSTEMLLTLNSFKLYLSLCLNLMRHLVNNENTKEKINYYCEKGIEKAKDSLRYDGKNPVINHGDCWSNNIMAKFDVSIKHCDDHIPTFEFFAVSIQSFSSRSIIVRAC